MAGAFQVFSFLLLPASQHTPAQPAHPPGRATAWWLPETDKLPCNNTCMECADRTAA